MITHGLMLVTAMMATLLLMPLVTRLGNALGMVDQPNGRKVHCKTMPRSGGMAMALGFLFTIVLFGVADRGIQGVLLGAAVIVLTGGCDDLWHIRPWQKFVGEVLAAALFVWWSGVSLHTLGDLIGVGPIVTGSFAPVITVIGIVGVINALNLSDGLDGLAGGLGAIACLFLGFFAYVSHHWACLSILVALFGSLLGFLYYNAHPARVFMGDSGSLLLGFLLSASAVLLAGKGGEHAVAPISMALVLALPIADTLFVMIRRMVLGFSPFSPDKTHLHHRLLGLGLPHGAVVSVLYGAMVLFGLIAVLMHTSPEWVQFAAGITAACVLYGPVIASSRIGYRWGSDGSDGSDGSWFHRLTAWSGRTVPLVTWLLPLLLLVPVFYLNALPAKVALLLMISAFGLLALYPLRLIEERMGVVHGLLYWQVFLLLAVFSRYGGEDLRLYLAVVTLLVIAWVAMKLVFKRNRRAFLTSGFEVLLIIVSWLIPNLLMHAAYLDEASRQQLMLACLESIPFLIAMKIVIRRQPHRNRTLMLSLAAILLIVATTGAMG